MAPRRIVILAFAACLPALAPGCDDGLTSAPKTRFAGHDAYDFRARRDGSEADRDWFGLGDSGRARTVSRGSDWDWLGLGETSGPGPVYESRSVQQRKRASKSLWPEFDEWLDELLGFGKPKPPKEPKASAGSGPLPTPHPRGTPGPIRED